jgi:MFS family permease
MSNDNRPPPRRTLIAIYAVGLFSQGVVPMATILLPLWMLQLGATATDIGIAAGCRSALSLFLSIHGGILIDRLGGRTVMLWSALTAVLLAPLHPLAVWIPLLTLLQLPLGLSHATVWIGAQTQINVLTSGDPRHVSRFTFLSTSGNFIAPLIAGAAWDVYGAFTAWAILMLLAVIALPMDRAATDAARPSLRALAPRLSDYATAFRMVHDPAVAFTIACSALAGVLFAVRNSFVPVYLDSIALSGTTIGVIMGASALVGSPAGLTIPFFLRFMKTRTFIVVVLAIATIAISATPLTADFSTILALTCIYGAGIGMTFPTLISFLSRSIGRDQQGMSAGLRVTANRCSALSVPIMMGAIADAWNLVASFLVIGAGTLIALVPIVWLTRRAGAFARHGEE